MLLKRLSLLALAMLLTLGVGCTTVQKWAAGGAVVGAGAGALGADLGHGISHGEGAAIGAAAGGLIGALLGDNVDQDMAHAACNDLLNEKMDEISMWQEKERQASAKLASAMQDLAYRNAEIEKLKSLGGGGGVEVRERVVTRDMRTEITIAADVLFRPGSDVLSDAGMKELDGAARKVKESGKRCVVEGHTDTDPVKASSWKSNWELGAARSLAVLHYMVSKGGVDSKKISAATFGEFKPVGSDKAKNRRAVIAIYSE